MSKQAIAFGALMVGSLSILGACGAVSPKTGEALEDSIRVYNEGVRWQRFDQAAARLPAIERATFVDEWDTRSKDLKITDYDIVGVEHKGKIAKVQVKLSWYSDGEGTLHETRATQIWERHGSAWFMVDETRLRGPEMPGLPNHSKRADADKAAKAKADKAAADKIDKRGKSDAPDSADRGVDLTAADSTEPPTVPPTP